MDQSWWATRIFTKHFLIMKIKLELFGASRDFSNKDFLEFDIKEKIEIKDLRKEIIDYLDINFKGNEDFINASASEVFILFFSISIIFACNISHRLLEV